MYWCIYFVVRAAHIEVRISKSGRILYHCTSLTKFWFLRKVFSRVCVTGVRTVDRRSFCASPSSLVASSRRGARSGFLILPKEVRQITTTGKADFSRTIAFRLFRAVSLSVLDLFVRLMRSRFLLSSFQWCRVKTSRNREGFRPLSVGFRRNSSSPWDFVLSPIPKEFFLSVGFRPLSFFPSPSAAETNGGPLLDEFDARLMRALTPTLFAAAVLLSAPDAVLADRVIGKCFAESCGETGRIS